MSHFYRMAQLLYITNMSLDGYIEDATGAFDWADPTHVFEAVTDLIRPIGTRLLGRKLAETMSYWDADVASYPPEQREFAEVWQRSEKIVFSRTPTGAGRIEPAFDSEMIGTLKRTATRDLFVGGAELAGRALDAGLVDACHLFVHPIVVARGKPAFRAMSPRRLELMQTRAFESGVVYLRYRVQNEAG